MAVHSHAFGRTVLTGRDADKFMDQMLHGRPAAAAVSNVKAGIEKAREMRNTGRVLLKVKAPAD